MVAWVTRPERPKGAKDEVKRPEGPPTRSRGPEGPETSSLNIFVMENFKKIGRWHHYLSWFPSDYNLNSIFDHCYQQNIHNQISISREIKKDIIGIYLCPENSPVAMFLYFFWHRFVKGAMNIVDLLGILPYFTSLILSLVTVNENFSLKKNMITTPPSPITVLIMQWKHWFRKYFFV